MRKSYRLLIVLFCFFNLFSISFSQILITEDSGGGMPDESAILQIDSDTKGVLIPRISTENRLLISAVEGLLVYDTDEGSFYLYGSSGWTNLSTSAEIWAQNVSSVYLSDATKNVGIGTPPSTSKFVVQADNGSLPDAVLFEVKDDAGIPIFRVTSEGVRIYVKEKTKGVSGGFAVGQYGSLKDVGDEYLIVTADSTRVYTLPTEKSVSGGFAVGQYSSLKGGYTTPNFYTNPGETRVYTGGAGKAVSGGFAVGQYGSLKGENDYLQLTPENYLIGHNAGNSLTPEGLYNTFFGYNSGYSTTTGDRNIFVGYYSGYSNLGGWSNLFIGDSAGYSNTSGNFNILLGNNAGKSNTEGFQNVAIGAWAGSANTIGNRNVFIGTGAGDKNTEGNYNVFIGNLTGRNNLTGGGNIFFGSYSGYDNTEGNNNIFMGMNAGHSNLTGTENVFIGNASGYDNTSGVFNTCIGFQSGNKTDANYNTFLGFWSGLDNTTGEFNTYIGAQAGESSDTGSWNTVVGSYACADSAVGDYNTIVGMSAGRYTEGDKNTYLGFYSGAFNTLGNNNVFIGDGAGRNSDGSNNVFLGRLAGINVKGSGKLMISNWDADSSQALIYGEFDNQMLRLNANVGIRINPIYPLHVGGDIKSEGAVRPNGIIFPNSFSPDEAYSAEGNYLAFGHSGFSEDFIGYKNNTFYFMDSPGGGDDLNPNVYIGGNAQIENELNRSAQGTADLMPIAYGKIDYNGTIFSGSGNFTVLYSTTGTYEISIEGETYDYQTNTAIVTPNSSVNARIANTYDSGDNLIVYIRDTTNTLVNSLFSFVVYKP